MAAALQRLQSLPQRDASHIVIPLIGSWAAAIELAADLLMNSIASILHVLARKVVQEFFHDSGQLDDTPFLTVCLAPALVLIKVILHRAIRNG